MSRSACDTVSVSSLPRRGTVGRGVTRPARPGPRYGAARHSKSLSDRQGRRYHCTCMRGTVDALPKASMPMQKPSDPLEIAGHVGDGSHAQEVVRHAATDHRLDLHALSLQGFAIGQAFIHQRIEIGDQQ